MYVDYMTKIPSPNSPYFRTMNPETLAQTTNPELQTGRATEPFPNDQDVSVNADLSKDDLLELYSILLMSGKDASPTKLPNDVLLNILQTLEIDPKNVKFFSNGSTRKCKDLMSKIVGDLATEYNRTTDLNVRFEEANLTIAQSNLKKIIRELTTFALSASVLGTPIRIEGSIQKESYIINIAFEKSDSIESKLIKNQNISLGVFVAQKLIELSKSQIEIVELDSTKRRITLNIQRAL